MLLVLRKWIICDIFLAHLAKSKPIDGAHNSRVCYLYSAGALEDCSAGYFPLLWPSLIRNGKELGTARAASAVWSSYRRQQFILITTIYQLNQLRSTQSPFTMTSKWAGQIHRQTDSQRAGMGKGERRTMAAVGQLIVLHFPPIIVQLFFLTLSASLAHDLCGAAALLIIAIIVATVYSFQLWQQRLDLPRHAKPCHAKSCHSNRKKKKQFSSEWIAWISSQLSLSVYVSRIYILIESHAI